MNGTAGFAVTDGAIRKIDLKKWHDAIETAFNQKTYTSLAELIPAPGDTTKFSHLYADTAITNGVVYNNNLRIESPELVRVTGKGSVSLPKETVDYTVALGKFLILVTGPFDNLKFRPDWETMLKALAEREIQKKKEEVKSKVEEKIEEKKEEIKEKVRDKLKDKLKGLFR